VKQQIDAAIVCFYKSTMSDHLRTVIIPDVHGSDRALSASLEHAGAADTVVTLGDYTDRGDENRRVLNRLCSMITDTKTRLVPLAGNHEVDMCRALGTEDAAQVWRWLKKGGHTLLREVAETQGLRLRRPRKMNFPVPVTEPEKQQRWRNFITKKDLAQIDLPATFQALKDMILSGEYAPLYRSLQIVAEIRHCCWAVHANVTNRGAKKGIDASNREFARLREAHYQEMPGGLMGMLEEFGKHIPVLDEKERSAHLKNKGVGLIIHGHASMSNGHPRVRRQGRLTIAGIDIAMSHGIKSPAEWGYASVDTDGAVTVVSSVMKKPTIIGTIDDENRFQQK